MEETKLIKLLDLALERIDYLEAEAIESDAMTNEELQNALDRTDADVRELLKENEGFRRTIEALERENSKLESYFYKANTEACELVGINATLKGQIEEKDAAIFELQQNLEKVSQQRNELVLETANAGEVAQIKKENENLKTTNADLLKRLEEAAEANDRLAYDLSNSEIFIELRNENEKLSNMIRMLKADKSILEAKLEDIAKNSGESSPAKWCDILDPTKRPRPNEPVLITTKSGKIIIGSFEVDGNIRSSGKPTKATAWMKLPKPFTK